jgi:hypothetical protein
MKRLTLPLLLIAIAGVTAAHAQTNADEDAVMQAAVQRHFTVTQPFYAHSLLFAMQTRSAEAPHSPVFDDAKISRARAQELVADFTSRNQTSRTIGFALPAGISSDDASREGIIAIAHIARPGFSADGKTAVVRIEIVREKITDTIAYVLERNAQARWTAIASVAPAEADDAVTTPALSASR